MPARRDDLPELPVLTLEQASDLLQRLQSGRRAGDPSVVVIALPAAPPQSNSSPRPDASTPRLPSLPAVPRDGLGALGQEVYGRLNKLVTFYLLGCAFQSGATSLHDASRELIRRRKAGVLPACVTVHPGDLSDLLTELEDVFAAYFGKTSVSFRASPRGEGRGSGLSQDGRRAWDATRELLAHNGWVPGW